MPGTTKDPPICLEIYNGPKSCDGQTDNNYTEIHQNQTQKSMICQPTRFHCLKVESSDGILYLTSSDKQKCAGTM